VHFALRVEVSVFNNKLFSMNLFRYQYFENYHLRAEVPSARRQGAAVPNKNIWGQAYLSAVLLGGAPSR